MSRFDTSLRTPVSPTSSHTCKCLLLSRRTPLNKQHLFASWILFCTLKIPFFSADAWWWAYPIVSKPSSCVMLPLPVKLFFLDQRWEEFLSGFSFVFGCVAFVCSSMSSRGFFFVSCARLWWWWICCCARLGPCLLSKMFSLCVCLAVALCLGEGELILQS